MILKSYNNVINLENYEEFLAMAQKEYVDSIKSENIINTYLCELASRITSIVISECGTFSNSVKDKLADLVADLQKFNVSMSFKTNLQVLNLLKEVNLP